MFCKNCGKEISDDSRFCEYCGANFAAGGAPPTGAPYVPPQQPAYYPPPQGYAPQQPYYPPQGYAPPQAGYYQPPYQTLPEVKEPGLFFKAIRHYADFCGRARRKEYWLFVLFYAVFYIVWMLACGVLLFATGIRDERLANSTLAIIPYSFLMILPMLAVTVRRLHDLGKSGWWYLIQLIPLIGSIWLFVLTVLPGDRFANKYGPDPKATIEPYSERRRLKSAGVAMIIGGTAALFTTLFSYITSNQNWGVVNVLEISGLFFVFLAGIFLLQWKTMHEKTTVKNIALILLLVSAVIGIVIGSIGGGGVLFSLPVIWVIPLLFLVIPLLFSLSKTVVRVTAIITLILYSMVLLVFAIGMSRSLVADSAEWLNSESFFLLIGIGVLAVLPIISIAAYILFAGAFIPKDKNQVAG